MKRSAAFVRGVVCALGLTAGGALPAALPAPALAEDVPGALDFFESKFAAMRKTCADKLWAVASDAKAQNFHQYAMETAQLVLDEWDPDHAAARAHLGYEKKGKDWAADPSANVAKQNTKNTKEAQSSYDAREKKWKEARAKVDQFVATKYAQVGDECAAKGYAEQAQKCWERALALWGDCEPARKGLGYARLGKLWVTQQKAAALKRAAEGAWVTEKSKLEEGLGVALHKIETPHFRIEDDGAKEALPDAAKALETLYAYYLADVGMDPEKDVLGGKKVELCVVSKKDAWDRWVDGFSGAKDTKWLKELNTYRDLFKFRTGTLRVETAEHVDTRDPLLHHAAHILNYAVWRATKHAWLDEGLAYYYTVKVQETTRTHCVAKKEGGYGKGEAIGGEKDWTVSERWKLYLKGVVQKKADAELRKILNIPLETLDLPASVKSWSVISFLMDTRRDKFIEFLKAMRDRKDADPPEEVLQRVFGTSVEAIDTEWRAWAVRAF